MRWYLMKVGKWYDVYLNDEKGHIINNRKVKKHNMHLRK